MHSPQFAGGWLPGVGLLGAPPFPVLTISVPGPSEKMPEPDCQMPAPSAVSSVVQRALTWPEVETPNSHPWYGS